MSSRTVDMVYTDGKNLCHSCSSLKINVVLSKESVFRVIKSESKVKKCCGILFISVLKNHFIKLKGCVK